jgi:quinol monooxygenase YgiN
MVLVTGSVVARADRVDEALLLSREHVLRSRAEPGCVAHAVHRDAENPARLVFVEQWVSQAALWAHFKVPASRAFVQALAAMAREAPSIAVYEATAVAVPSGNA